MALPNVSPIVKVYYGKPVLPEVSRVLACLYEKDFELVAFEDVDCMPVDLIRLQASTRVPTPFFEDGPKFLFESRAICRYISETYADRGNRHLLGRDLLDRVSIEQWLKSEEQSFDPPCRALVLHLAFPTSSNKSYNDLLEESKRLSKVLDVYNHRLGESQYLAGDEFTLADLTHLPNSRYIATSEEWGHLFDERENVKRWWEEVSARPSWMKVEDEIERSEEIEDEEEMTEETEDNFIGITRCVNPKMSLRAGTFKPVETILPAKPKSTFTISKNEARPSGSVQVTVPDKRGFSVSVPEQKVTHVETTRIQPHTKQPVADAKVTMQESTIPTARIDKASTEETRVISHSTKPVTSAKVTMEGSNVLPTGAQMPSTARIDKTRAEQTRASPQSTKPVTDAKVTVEKTSSPPAARELPPTHETTPESAKVTEKYAAYPTDETSTTKSRGFLFRQAPTSTSKTEQLSLESTEAPPTEKTTEKPLTRDQGQTLSPPTATEVIPTHETTTESAKVPEKYTASQADETRSDSCGLRFTQVPVPTSKAVLPIKQSLEGSQSPPTEKTSTKPPTKDQGQTLTKEPKHGQAAEETTNKEKYSASQADETRRTDSRGMPFTQVPVPTNKTVQLKKQSPEGPQSPPTEERAYKPPTKDQGQTLTTESKHGQAAEEPTNKEDEIDAEGYIIAKRKDWEEQWKKPEKFGEEKHAEDIPAQKPQPPKVENTTPPTTQSPPTITSSETTRQEPVPYKSTNTQAKEPSESRTTTKPKDTTPSATQANTIPDGTQDIVTGETTAASSASSASNQGSVLQSTSETQNGITDKTSNAPAPKPPKQEGSTTPTPARITTSQTAKQEPMTNKSITAPAKEPSRSTVLITQEERFPRKTTTKPQDKTPEVMTQQTTAPAATQEPPPLSTNETKDVIANRTNSVPTQSPTTGPPKPMADKPDNVSAIETSKPTVPETEEETSRGTTTKEPKGEIPMGTETPFLASTQNSSSETTGKDQALPATTQRPPASKTTTETTGKDQARPYTKQTPPTNETEAGYADISQSKTASSSTNSGIDLEKSSQTDTQMRKSEEEQAFPSGTTFKTRSSFPSDQKSDLFQDENSPSLRETDPASDRSTTEPDTAPKQKETFSETKTEPKKLETNKPNKTTSQPNKTRDNENLRPVDETIIEKTKDEASPVQTPPRDVLTKGVPSAQTTSSEKGAKQPASLEEATKDQASKSGELSQDDKSFSSQTPTSNNQNGGEREKSSSVIKTAPTSDGRSKEPDTTPKKKEPQNETKIETEIGPNQLGTNKPNQITSLPNNTNDANPMNDSLSETNQNKASPQDNEVISSNESAPEPQIEQNNKPDTTNNPGPANKE